MEKDTLTLPSSTNGNRIAEPEPAAETGVNPLLETEIMLEGASERLEKLAEREHSIVKARTAGGSRVKTALGGPSREVKKALAALKAFRAAAEMARGF